MDVVANSPASRAGLQVGDVIKGIDGEAIAKPDEIQQAVQKAEVGSELPIQLKRDGKKVDLKVEVGVLPTTPQTAQR